MTLNLQAAETLSMLLVTDYYTSVINGGNLGGTTNAPIEKKSKYRMAHETPAHRLVDQIKQMQTQHIVIQYAAACTKVHCRTKRSFSTPLTSKYFAFAFV
jgi:hypothetical protein